MTKWSLGALFSSLHDDIKQRLQIARTSMGHPGSKGDASENVWLSLLDRYLPNRYKAATAHVVDSEGTFSDQIDVVIFDRQYSPFIFHFEDQKIIPAESVYAVFESKQTINAGNIDYAQNKMASVRRLYRTSLPIPHAGGLYKPKPLSPIIGGFLSLESDWKPALGDSLVESLNGMTEERHLDMGCVAGHGYFTFDADTKDYKLFPNGKPATSFLFHLIDQLQAIATVPMIDIKEYARWI